VYPLSILLAIKALLFLYVESRAAIDSMSGELETARRDSICSVNTAIARGAHG